MSASLWSRTNPEKNGGISHTRRIQYQSAVGYISLTTVYANNLADSLKCCSDRLLTASDRLRGEQHETDTSALRAKHAGSLICVFILAPIYFPLSQHVTCGIYAVRCISWQALRHFCLLCRCPVAPTYSSDIPHNPLQQPHIPLCISEHSLDHRCCWYHPLCFNTS